MTKPLLYSCNLLWPRGGGRINYVYMFMQYVPNILVGNKHSFESLMTPSCCSS